MAQCRNSFLQQGKSLSLNAAKKTPTSTLHLYLTGSKQRQSRVKAVWNESPASAPKHNKQHSSKEMESTVDATNVFSLFFILLHLVFEA